MTLPLLLSRDGLTKKHGLVVKKGCVIIVIDKFIPGNCCYKLQLFMIEDHVPFVQFDIG